jgi:hypothetical protein
MKDSKTLFRLKQAQDAKRIAEIQAAQFDTASSLESELAMARMLLERATNDGQLVLANQFLKSIAQLTVARDAARQKQGLLLTRSALHRFAQQIVEIFIDELSGRPGYEDVVDAVCERTLLALSNLANTPKEIEGK